MNSNLNILFLDFGGFNDDGPGPWGNWGNGGGMRGGPPMRGGPGGPGGMGMKPNFGGPGGPGPGMNRNGNWNGSGGHNIHMRGLPFRASQSDIAEVYFNLMDNLILDGLLYDLC